MTGTLTITTPATDSASGYSSTSIPVAWTFTGSPASTTQTQRQVTVQVAGSATVLADTGMQATSATTYTATGLSTGVSYQVTVTVIDSAGTTSTATRIIVTNYARSLSPTLTFGTDGLEALQIYVANPVDGSARPTVTSNDVYRRVTGSTGAWTYVGTAGNNGQLTDRFLRPSSSYDYFARTDTGADSIPYTAITPFTTGLWIWDPTQLNATIRHFPYGAASTETLEEEEAALQFVGRKYPIVESGLFEDQSLAFAVMVPFSEDWSAQVEWWRARKRDRVTLLIRDSSGHVFACRILGAITITPTAGGRTVAGTLQRVDYAASTIELNASAYNQGANNDGGNGVYGNGSQGNGY